MLAPVLTWVWQLPGGSVSQRAIVANADAVPVEVGEPIPPALALSLAHLAATNGALGDLWRVGVGLYRTSVQLCLSHWSALVPSSQFTRGLPTYEILYHGVETGPNERCGQRA